MPRLPTVVAVSVVALLAASGCGAARDVKVTGTTIGRPAETAPPSPGATSTPTTAPPAARLTWEPCGKGRECATLPVPLDHADPTGPTIDLAVMRRPAGDEDKRVGSLLVNPGGPGVPGTSLVTQASLAFSDDLLDRFDIVSWDPRGTGRSRPVDCVDDLDPYLALDPTPDSPEEQAVSRQRQEQFAAACLQRYGDALGRISTVDTAKDMDLLRAALGEEQVTYLGFSYGSELGATYATLFPNRVRAMVLDGAADANASFAQSAEAQAVSVEQAFNRVMEQCARDEGCAFHNGGDPWTAYDQLWNQVDLDPLEVEPDRPPVNQGVMWWAVLQSLYDEGYWSELTDALADAQRGDGRGLLNLYDSYTERDPDTATWSNTFEALIAINCLDDPGPTAPDEMAALAARLREVAPRVGGVGDDSNQCATWPVGPVRRPFLDAKGAGPVVVVGTTGDPITPLTSSSRLAEDLEGGVLLTVDAEGHTGYLRNRCVTRAVDRYLINLEVPEAGKVCK